MSEKEQKTHSASVRLPIELYERFARLKEHYFHEDVPDSKLLVEAVRLYVTLGEQVGIGKKYKIEQTPVIMKPQETEAHKKPHPLRRPQSA